MKGQFVGHERAIVAQEEAYDNLLILIAQPVNLFFHDSLMSQQIHIEEYFFFK